MVTSSNMTAIHFMSNCPFGSKVIRISSPLLENNMIFGTSGIHISK
jgi:hypothetical protein